MPVVLCCLPMDLSWATRTSSCRVIGSGCNLRTHSAAFTWTGHPAPFSQTPEGSVLDKELIVIAQREMERLPDIQRIAVNLREMLGFDSDEVCE
jgi:DNA-directed RNA polymerase specialized sigma24 family protein